MSLQHVLFISSLIVLRQNCLIFYLPCPAWPPLFIALTILSVALPPHPTCPQPLVIYSLGLKKRRKKHQIFGFSQIEVLLRIARSYYGRGGINLLEELGGQIGIARHLCAPQAVWRHQVQMQNKYKDKDKCKHKKHKYTNKYKTNGRTN